MSAVIPASFGKLGGRRKPAGVKLVEGAQLLGREPLILRSEGNERGLQPLGQAGRAIVVAHPVKDIGHGKVPPGLGGCHGYSLVSCDA